MGDRHAKKLEKKRKQRDTAKRQGLRLAARRPDGGQQLVHNASRAPMGPCWISADWANLEQPSLVTAVVTRQLPDGGLVPAVALVDRTCLGVKNGFVAAAMPMQSLRAFLEPMARGHGGMLCCEPLLVQSVVFHAIDYARQLGFEPHRDFPASLFGPRPSELLRTAWHALDKPWYFSGPRDDVRAVLRRLESAVGLGNFDYFLAVEGLDDEDDDHDGKLSMVLPQHGMIDHA